jgi:hypothetical protein
VGTSSSSSRTLWVSASFQNLWVSTSFQTLCHYMTSSSSLKARQLANSHMTALLPNPDRVCAIYQFEPVHTQNSVTTQSLQSLGNYSVISSSHIELRYYPILIESRKLFNLSQFTHIIALLPNPYGVSKTNVPANDYLLLPHSIIYCPKNFICDLALPLTREFFLDHAKLVLEVIKLYL